MVGVMESPNLVRLGLGEACRLAGGAVPPGLGIVEGGEIPYQPWALAKRKENREKRMMVDVTNDKKWHDLGDPELIVRIPALLAEALCHRDKPDNRRRRSAPIANTSRLDSMPGPREGFGLNRGCSPHFA